METSNCKQTVVLPFLRKALGAGKALYRMVLIHMWCTVAILNMVASDLRMLEYVSAHPNHQQQTAADSSRQQQAAAHSSKQQQAATRQFQSSVYSLLEIEQPQHQSARLCSQSDPQSSEDDQLLGDVEDSPLNSIGTGKSLCPSLSQKSQVKEEVQKHLELSGRHLRGI